MPLQSTRGAASAKAFGFTAGGKSFFIGNFTISTDTSDYDMRSAAVAGGWDGTTDANITVTINSPAIVNASSTGTPAFNVGSPWPAGSLLTVVNNGVILGRGGNGGNGNGGTGNSGGTGLNTGRAVTMTNNNRIAGGGGGGGAGGQGTGQEILRGPINSRGGGGGGGGIGTSSGGSGGPGTGSGTPGTSGTTSAAGPGGPGAARVGSGGTGGPGGAGGSYGSAGTGGTPGTAGSAGSSTSGGPAGSTGSAILGYSYITFTTTGTINGPTSG